MPNYKDVEVLNRDIVYQGYYQVECYRIKYKKYNNKWGEPVNREVFERGNSAAILLYDPFLNNIVLIEQFRIGAMDQIKQQQSPWLLEIVAGTVELNETAEEVARRETLEETDLTFTDYIKIGEFYNSPGACTEKCILFCAKIDSSQIAINKKETYGLAAEHEDIKRILVSLDQALVWLNAGKIKNIVTVVALQWLQINQNSLKNKWIIK